MTGLDKTNDALIEVAVLVTDGDLEILGEGEFAQFMSYRTIDVSSLKELAKRWFPRVFFNTPEKHGGHRALADIRESIQELKYYREVLFVKEPGPTSDEARAASKKFEIAPQ